MVRKNVRHADGRSLVAYHVELRAAQNRAPQTGSIPSGSEIELIAEVTNQHSKILYEGQHVFVRNRHIVPPEDPWPAALRPPVRVTARHANPNVHQVAYHYSVAEARRNGDANPAGWLDNGEPLDFVAGDYTNLNLYIELGHGHRRIFVQARHLSIDDDAEGHPRYAAAVVARAKRELEALGFPRRVVDEVDSEGRTRLQRAAQNNHAEQARSELRRAGRSLPLYLTWPCPLLCHPEDRDARYCEGVDDRVKDRLERHGMSALHFAVRFSSSEALDVLLEFAGQNCMHYLAQTDTKGANAVDLLCKEQTLLCKKDPLHRDYARCLDVVFKHINRHEPSAVDYFFKRHTLGGDWPPQDGIPGLPPLAAALRTRGPDFLQSLANHVGRSPRMVDLLSCRGPLEHGGAPAAMIFGVFLRSESRPDAEPERAAAMLESLLRCVPDLPGFLQSTRCPEGKTCLHRAMGTRSGVLARVLLQSAGAPLAPHLCRLTDSAGNTPLHEALRRQCAEGLECALGYLAGATDVLSVQGEDYMSAAHLCANEGQRLRPQHGGDRDDAGFLGGLFGGLGAGRRGRHEERQEPNQTFTRMMGDILRLGSDRVAILLGQRDGSGRTPFHYAAMRGNVLMLELMKRYLDRYVPQHEARRILLHQDSRGKTARDVARRRYGAPVPDGNFGIADGIANFFGFGGAQAPQPRQPRPAGAHLDAYEYLDQFYVEEAPPVRW